MPRPALCLSGPAVCLLLSLWTLQPASPGAPTPFAASQAGSGAGSGGAAAGESGPRSRRFQMPPGLEPRPPGCPASWALLGSSPSSRVVCRQRLWPAQSLPPGPREAGAALPGAGPRGVGNHEGVGARVSLLAGSALRLGLDDAGLEATASPPSRDLSCHPPTPSFPTSSPGVPVKASPRPQGRTGHSGEMETGGELALGEASWHWALALR